MTRGSLWAAGCRVLQFLLRWPVRVFKKVRQNKLGIFFNVFVCLFVFCSKPLLPEGQFLDQHQQHRLRACWMCGPSSPRPGQPRQKLTFDKAPDNSSAQCSLRSPGLNDKDGVRVFCLAGGPRGLSTPCLFSLFELSQVLSVIGLRPSSPGLHRVHMRSYPTLLTLSL